MASMKGGHFLTVECSACRVVLKAFCGIVLNQSGSPSTAGNGRGRIDSSSGGQRNVIVRRLDSSIIASPVDNPLELHSWKSQGFDLVDHNVSKACVPPPALRAARPRAAACCFSPARMAPATCKAYKLHSRRGRSWRGSRSQGVM